MQHVEAFDKAKVHVESFSDSFANIYYDDSYVGSVIRLGHAYRGTVQIAKGARVMLDNCDDAESLAEAATLVARSYYTTQGRS